MKHLMSHGSQGNSASTVQGFATENLPAYDFFLVDAIGHPVDYIPLLEVLATAPKGTSVVLHLNSPGGMLDTSIHLVNAIRNSPADVTALIIGPIASGATLIAHACDSIVIAGHVSCMYHDGSGGMMGKVNENARQADFIQKQLSALYHDVYSNALTPEEIEDVLAGRDLWLTGEELSDRLERYMEGMAEKAVSTQSLVDLLAEQDLEQEEGAAVCHGGNAGY